MAGRKAGGRGGAGRPKAKSKASTKAKEGGGRRRTADGNPLPPDARAVGAMVGMVPPATALRLLAAELRRSPAALERFAGAVRRERAKKMQRDYRADMDAILKRAAGGRRYIDRHVPMSVFAGPLRDAADSERLGDYAEAARAYGGICEAFIGNMGLVRSGSGRFHARTSLCIRRMGGCAARARGPAERRKALSHLMHAWICAGYGHKGEMEEAMLAGMADPGDAAPLLAMLGAAPREDGYDAEKAERLGRRLEEARERLAKKAARRKGRPRARGGGRGAASAYKAGGGGARGRGAAEKRGAGGTAGKRRRRA